MRMLLAAVVGVSAGLLSPNLSFAQAAGQFAWVELTVPADASVWIDGQATMQRGTERHFVSPPLQVGKRYHYDVRVQWTKAGKTLERTRRVHFRAGEEVGLTLSGTDEPTIEIAYQRSSGENVRALSDVAPTTTQSVQYPSSPTPPSSSYVPSLPSSNPWRPDPSDPFTNYPR